MDREQLADQLAVAERHVEQAYGHIAGQRELVARLRRGGHDTTAAQHLLAEFMELLKVHEADRDRLRELVRSQKPN